MLEVFTVGGGDYLVNTFNAIAAWTGVLPAPTLPPLWHGHEMVFGFAGAIVAASRPLDRSLGNWRHGFGDQRGRIDHLVLLLGLGFGGGSGCARLLLGLQAGFLGGLLARFLFLAAALGFQACLLLGIALGLRLLELAQGVLALGIEHLALVLDHAALHIGAFLAHFDVDCLGRRAALPRIDGQLADGATLQGDLLGRAVIARGFALAMVAAQEAEQLYLFLAADRLLRVGELHPGFLELREQLVDRSGQHRGQLLDCYVRHTCVLLTYPRLPHPCHCSAASLPAAVGSDEIRSRVLP